MFLGDPLRDGVELRVGKLELFTLALALALVLRVSGGESSVSGRRRGRGCLFRRRRRRRRRSGETSFEGSDGDFSAPAGTLGRLGGDETVSRQTPSGCGRRGSVAFRLAVGELWEITILIREGSGVLLLLGGGRRSRLLLVVGSGEGRHGSVGERFDEGALEVSGRSRHFGLVHDRPRGTRWLLRVGKRETCSAFSSLVGKMDFLDS